MNGLLIVPPVTGCIKNIGDYIQSVAQEQFWHKIDCYVEREKLASFSSKETVNLIMQGWFMWIPEQFPPSSCINPFFISFHLTPLVADTLLSKESIEYFKKFEPIGCRDYYTKNILEDKGIKCYFSGCLTLTLDLNYKTSKKNDETYIVDPYIEIGGSKDLSKRQRCINLFSAIFKQSYKINKILKIKEKLFGCRCFRDKTFKGKLKELFLSFSFYDTYSKVFDDNILLESQYLTHIISVAGMSEKDKLELARDYIRRYAKAKMVITSRIHAALPCLAIGTPTIFISSDYLTTSLDKNAPGGRFGGLVELMNCFVLKGNRLFGNNTYTNNLLQKTITKYTIIKNPEKHSQIREDLIKRTRDFINKCNPRWGGVKGSAVMMSNFKRMAS